MIVDGFDEMVEQCEQQPLVCAVAMHPMTVGQPFRMKLLRDAFAKAIKDPELIAEAKRARIDCSYISGEQVANIGSQTMNHEVWLKLAKRVNEVLKGDTDGVVITHGTDTMAETAASIAKAQIQKTIVLTGAMIPYKFGSSDGLFNLGSALAFVQILNPGVYIAMNGKIFEANKVQKNTDKGEFETT